MGTQWPTKRQEAFFVWQIAPYRSEMNWHRRPCTKNGRGWLRFCSLYLLATKSPAANRPPSVIGCIPTSGKKSVLIGKRSSDWLKIKVAQTAEFEVIGCVPMRGEKAIKVLLLGERDRSRLVYKGKVGSGLTRKQREDLLAELMKAPKLQEPLDCPSGSICRLPGWRCRVRYFGLTEMGHLRTPTFEGLV